MAKKKAVQKVKHETVIPLSMTAEDAYQKIIEIRDEILQHKESVLQEHPELSADEIPAPSNLMERMIELGRNISIGIDIRRFIMGLLAGMIEVSYGEANMQKFADAVKLKVKTVYQYSQIVAIFGFSTCVDYLNAGAQYSHLRAVMYYGEDVFDKLQLLDHALDYHWSAERLEAEAYGREADSDEGSAGQKKQTLCNLAAATVTGYDYRKGLITLNVGDDLSKLIPYLNKTVQLKISVDQLQAVTSFKRDDAFTPAADPDEDEDETQDDDLSISPDEDEEDDLDYIPRRGHAQPAEEDEIEFSYQLAPEGMTAEQINAHNLRVITEKMREG